MLAAVDDKHPPFTRAEERSMLQHVVEACAYSTIAGDQVAAMYERLGVHFGDVCAGGGVGGGIAVTSSTNREKLDGYVSMQFTKLSLNLLNSH